MSKIKIQVNADLSVIKSQLRKNEKFSQGIRLHAVYQIVHGMDVKDLEAFYSSCRKSIYNRVLHYNAEVVEGLKNRPRCGRNLLPDAAGKAKLEKIILHTPQEYGYDTATWTGASVCDYIKKRYGIEYKKVHIYNILHSVGFSFQKWKDYFPEAENREERVEAVKKTSDGRKEQRDGH